jgi:hypothetical protein
LEISIRRTKSLSKSLSASEPKRLYLTSYSILFYSNLGSRQRYAISFALYPLGSSPEIIA